MVIIQRTRVVESEAIRLAGALEQVFGVANDTVELAAACEALSADLEEQLKDRERTNE